MKPEKENIQTIVGGSGVGLTCGAVVARPVGIAAAGPRLCQEGAVSGALVHAGGPGALTPRAAPTHEAVALSLDAHPSARARGVQAVHCTQGSNRESMSDAVQTCCSRRNY